MSMDPMLWRSNVELIIISDSKSQKFSQFSTDYNSFCVNVTVITYGIEISNQIIF